MASRKQAQRLPRPAVRYWKGKAPKGADPQASDSELEEEEAQSNDVQDIPITSHEADEDEDEDLPLRTEAAQVSKGIEISFQDVSARKELKEELYEEEEEEEGAV
jgi:microfibrillar-associated protein 1